MRSYLKINGIAISILLIWFFINLICLILCKNSELGKDYFFPFNMSIDSESGNSDFSKTYDFSEFLIYGISPVLLFLILKIISNDKQAN